MGGVMQVIVPTWLEMSKKARNVNVQRFPGASIGKWRQMLLDHSVSEYFEAILIPQNPASQLKAVRKLVHALEHGGCEGDRVWLQVLVEIHSSCSSRHPLQRAIASMLLGLPGGQQDMVANLVAENLRAILQQQLKITSGQQGEGLTQNQSGHWAAMQYMESLLENFTIGERGLRNQLPLALNYCSGTIGIFQQLKCYSSSYDFNVFVDTMKITMNILQKNTLEFFDSATESCCWSSLSCPVPPEERPSWLRARMGEILETCEQLLLKGDLPHDAIVSAAMLMVVASNILNSASKESYAEYINGWLTRERWMPFPKLAVCHALLAKIPSSLLLAVSLGREEPLILDLFPMLCQLFDGFSESSDRYIASRALALWSSVVRDCVLGGEEDSVLSAAMAPSGQAVQKLLHYVWSLWEDPIDGIRHQCKEMFENIVKIYKNSGPESGLLVQLANQLLSLDSPSRGKFVLLSLLSQHLLAGLLVSSHPCLPTDLLAVMGHQALACHAGELWSRLVQHHWTEASGGEEEEAIWHDVWVLSLLRAMCTMTQLARRHVSQHCLPSLFRSNDSCMEYVNQNLPSIDASPDSRVAVQLACLRCAKAECKNFSQSAESIATIFKSSMHHSEDQIRLSALNLVCESVKTTDAPPISHLRLLLEFIEVNGNSQSPGFREPALTAFKKVLNRVKDSSYALLKLHLKGCGSDPSPCIQSYKDFLCELLEQQFKVLHPLSSFQHRNFSLSLLSVMMACFQDPQSGDVERTEGGGTNIVPPVFLFAHQVSRHHALSLWEGLRDQYDANRVLCLKLLLALPKDRLLGKGDFVRDSAAEFLALVSKPKSASCASAAFMLKFFLATACLEFNRHLAELAGEDVMESLLSRRDHHPPFFVTLSLLCGLLSRHIAASESDLLAASMTAPMYGILQSIRAIFEQEPASTLESCREHLRETLGRLVETCRVLSEVVSPVVCSSSPEGFLPDAPRGGVSRLLEEEKEEEGEGVESDRGIGGNAQSLLLCCWHTMKEVSLLLGLLVQHFSVPMEDQLSPPPLLTSQQMKVIADIFIHQLTEARHRGAFEMAYTGFSRLCHALWVSSDEVLSRQPSVWVGELLESLQSSSVAKLLTVTRRSAGLPFFMQAILTSEPSLSGRTCLKTTMEVLLKVAHDATSDQAPPTLPSEIPDESAAAVITMQPAALHALNILRALYRDSRLGEQVTSFVPQGVKVAIAGFAANHWPVRNSSNLLFTALVLRMFGAKRVHDEHSVENKLTAREFFTRFPTLYSYLLQQLQDSAQLLEAGSGARYPQPSLFPVLILLSRLYPSPLDEPHSPTSIKPFIPLLIRCACCCVWKTRELVSRALSLMLTEQDCVEVVREIYARVSLSDQNTLHGLLCIVSRILKDREKLVGCVVEVEEYGRKPLSHILLRLHLQKWWIGSNNNCCAVTRSLYHEVLNTLLESAGREHGGVVSWEDAGEGLPLRTLRAHSLDVCRGSQNQSSLLPYARLLVTAAESHDRSHDLACISEALLSVLSWTKEPSVLSFILQKRSVLEGEAMLERLVLRATKDSDPDILSLVYDYLSRESVLEMVQKMNEVNSEEGEENGSFFLKVVSRSYHLFLQAHSRIEFRVSLIGFLTSALPLLQPQAGLSSSQLSREHCILSLLTKFQQLIVPTQPFQIRLAVAAGLMNLWQVALEGGSTLLAPFCQLGVQLLQDTDCEVREELAKVVSTLLTSIGLDGVGMNSSSALKFFIRFLPKLVMDGGSCFELLLSLLPEAAPSDPAASSNPLFDEDPLNDFAEDLVVMEHVVQSLEGVVTELTRTKQLSMRHYSSLSKIIPPQTLTQVSGSWWENKHAFLNQKKAQLLSPLLTAIGEAVNCGLEDPTKALHL